MYTNTLKALAVAGLLFASLATATAATPAGLWRGTVTTRKKDVNVTIRFHDDQASLHFDQPYACDATAKLTGEKGNKLVYTFLGIRPTGEFCDSLPNYVLETTTYTAGHLTVRVKSPGEFWDGELLPLGAMSL
jgi:hypothetical protein